jgi:succinate dehydrogenase/fumarate reductase cytochrome b subunit
MIAPLLAALAQVALFMVLPASGDGGLLGIVNNSLAGLIVQLLNGFGLAVALIGADAAWRRGRAPFEEAWEEARRKVSDILIATIGFNFVIFLATYVGGMLLSLIGGLVLGAVALFFCIYALPAASIGGIPGGASLQVSLERARSAPLPTFVVCLVFVLTYYVLRNILATFVLQLLIGLNVPSSTAVSSLVVALIQAILAGYVALVLSKAYNDVSYRRMY